MRQGIERLRRQGAEVREVSLPLFEYGEAIWLGVGTHSVSAMIESDQEGYWRGGHCNVAWQAAFGNARRARADDLLRAAKFRLILGAYLKESYQSTYFSKAQNLRMMLRDGVNALLREVDVLATPTTPQKPFKLEQTPDPEGITLGTSMSQNTSPFNLTVTRPYRCPAASELDCRLGYSSSPGTGKNGFCFRSGVRSKAQAHQSRDSVSNGRVVNEIAGGRS